MKNYLTVNKGVYLLIFSMLLTFTKSFSQNEFSPSEKEDFRKAVLENMEENTSLSGKFIQIQEMAYMQSEVESSGVFFYKKPNQLKWSYKKPYLFSLLFKNGNLTINNRGEKKSVAVSSNPLFKKLSKLIAHSINGELLGDKDFTASYLHDKGTVLVRLTPRKKDLKDVFSQVELYFDPETLLVKKTKLTQPEGDFTIIRFENVKLNTNIPNSTFIN